MKRRTLRSNRWIAYLPRFNKKQHLLVRNVCTSAGTHDHIYLKYVARDKLQSLQARRVVLLQRNQEAYDCFTVRFNIRNDLIPTYKYETEKRRSNKPWKLVKSNNHFISTWIGIIIVRAINFIGVRVSVICILTTTKYYCEVSYRPLKWQLQLHYIGVCVKW